MPSPAPRAILPDGCGEAEAFALLLDEAMAAPQGAAETEEADPEQPELGDATALPAVQNPDVCPAVEESGDRAPGAAGMDAPPNTSALPPRPDISGHNPPDTQRKLAGQPDRAVAAPSLIHPEAASMDMQADPAETLVLLRAERIEPRGIVAPPAADPPGPDHPLLLSDSPEAMAEDQAAPAMAGAPGEPTAESAEPARHPPSRLPGLPPALQPLATRIAEALGPDNLGDGISLDLAAGELGPLRLIIRGEGDRIEVHVMAESAGTLDLMRRHAEQLAQELRHAGYRQAEMSFGSREQERRPPAAGPSRNDPVPVPPGTTRPIPPAAGRLDLRI